MRRIVTSRVGFYVCSWSPQSVACPAQRAPSSSEPRSGKALAMTGSRSKARTRLGDPRIPIIGQVRARGWSPQAVSLHAQAEPPRRPRASPKVIVDFSVGGIDRRFGGSPRPAADLWPPQNQRAAHGHRQARFGAPPRRGKAVDGQSRGTAR